MKPEHIKEAIPNLGRRIKFENLYSKFLSGLDEVIVVNSKNDVSIEEIDTSNTEMDFGRISDQLLMTLDKENVENNQIMIPNVSKEKTYLQTAKVLVLLSD